MVLISYPVRCGICAAGQIPASRLVDFIVDDSTIF